MALAATQIPTKTEVNLQRLLFVCEERISKEGGLLRGPEKTKYVTVRYLNSAMQVFFFFSSIKATNARNANLFRITE